MRDVTTYFRINATDEGGLFYLGMSSFGSTVKLYDVNIQQTFTNTNGGIFAVTGTTSDFEFYNTYIYDPTAKGGDGGVFYFFNTLTTTMLLY